MGVFRFTAVLWSFLAWREVCGHAASAHGHAHQLAARADGGGGADISAFNIVNGRIFTPGLAIILAPQPFTPMGGDFLHIALDISGDGALPVPPATTTDALTQIHNITIFLTSTTTHKNFTISNLTTTTPPFADILQQEPSQTVKHINFEWPACLAGTNNDDGIIPTARGDYNISIHQNYRLNGEEFYTIFNLPISVTNAIAQFPSADQLLTVPKPGPLSESGGRVGCKSIENELIEIGELVKSVNNPAGQPFQDIEVKTSEKGGGGQVGSPGEGGGIGSSGASVKPLGWFGLVVGFAFLAMAL